MTKKEFLSRAYGQDRLALADLAEEAGVKFDPEPVDLPRLKWLGGDRRGFVGADCSPGRGRLLEPREGQEVIRRCDVVSKLKAYIVSLGLSQAGVTCYHLRRWLDGTLPVPDVTCSEKDGCGVVQSTQSTSGYDSGWIEDPDGEVTSRP